MGIAYSAVSRAEAIKLLLRSLELILRHNGFQDFFSDVPQLLMLGFDQKHDPTSLGVEAAGNMENGVLDDLLDTGVGNRGLVLEGVVRAALDHGVEEGLSGHIGGG